ncbi:MAG: hypothetical protein VX250_03350 [Planctomycetota bacterium]|nr:hypothetical protein [Planctomycetota bacterium]
MSESEKPEETLTEEELEILGQVLDNIVSGAAGADLAADVKEQPPAGELAAEGKILLALSSADDRNLLDGICRELDDGILHIRNRYSVLDELRRQPVRLVVSDLCLWGDGGQLLSERMTHGSGEIPVIFIREPGEELSDQARDVIACGVLDRPLQAPAVEALVRNALAGPVSDDAAQREEEAHEEPGEPVDDSRHPRHWLPFFFDARKSLRTSDYKGRRFRLVLGLLGEHLSPESAFLLERDSEGTRLQAFTHADRDSIDTDDLLARIREILGKGQLVGHGENGELAFKLPARGGCRRLIYIEFGSKLLGWESEYLDELLHLLAEEV